MRIPIIPFVNLPPVLPEFSLPGRKLTAHSGIMELMTDLGRAMTTDPDMRMLGGGNPAAVPEVQALLRARMTELLGEPGAFERIIGNYDPPRGNPRFLEAMAGLLRRTYGWDVGPDNIAVTCGGQTACFFLFNLLAGRFAGGRMRKILLPLAPEYIGYADQGIEPDMFVSCRPRIEWPEGPERRIFKYRIDLAAVSGALENQEIGAIAASRPTNPSGNVLTDEEVASLADLARQRGLPLILDSAYGEPFPGLSYVPARPFWAPHVILTLSLSKLGLPGARTGIVVASPEIASAIGSMTAVVGLANTGMGQHLVLPWIEDGSILRIGPELLRPFYLARREAAAIWMREYFDAAGIDWAVHASEGAFFHWVWLRGLKVRSRELYRRLKARKVLTVPGKYFFFGMPEWEHEHECMRLNFSREPETVRESLRIIAEEAGVARQ